MRRLTIQLLGYIGWIHDFLLSNGCWFGLCVYIYIHMIIPPPLYPWNIPSSCSFTVTAKRFTGSTPKWPRWDRWFPSSPKMGWIDGAKNTYGWILEEHIMNYYEFVYLICYIYIDLFHVPCASGRTDMLMVNDLFRFLWEDYWPSFLQLTYGMSLLMSGIGLINVGVGLAFGFSSNGKHCLTRGREINFQSSKLLPRFLA